MIFEDPFQAGPASPRLRSGLVARRPELARAVRADILTPEYGPVLIWGEPKIGKTTLVRQVLWSLEPDQYLMARLPVGSLAEPIAGSARGLGVLVKQIAVQLDAAGAESRTLRSVKGLDEALDLCLTVASRLDRRFILVLEGLDRYAGGVWPSGVKEHLTAIGERRHALSLVATLRVPVPRVQEEIELVDEARIHFVPPLERMPARQLLTGLVAGEIEYGHQSLDRLLVAAGGRPSLIHIIARNSLRLARADQISCITQAETEEIITCCWLAGEQVFRPLIANLRPRSQRVLWALALASQHEPAVSLTAIVEVLRRTREPLAAEDVVVQLDLLEVWRVAEHLPNGCYQLTCSWLGDFLRAGAERRE